MSRPQNYPFLVSQTEYKLMHTLNTFELGVDRAGVHHDAPPDLEGVGAVGDRVEAGLGDGPAGLLVGVVGHVHHKLGADVLELVLQLHGLGQGDAVLEEI